MHKPKNQPKIRHKSQLKPYPSKENYSFEETNTILTKEDSIFPEVTEIDTGFPEPDKYNDYFVNKYSLPRSFKCGYREDKEIRRI